MTAARGYGFFGVERSFIESVVKGSKQAVEIALKDKIKSMRDKLKQLDVQDASKKDPNDK